MTTITKTILPIPEQVIVGSGSYTVPANKYGFFQGNVSVTGHSWASNTSNGYNTASALSDRYFSQDGNRQGTAGANNATQWLVEGDTISVSSNLPSVQSSGSTNTWLFANYRDAYARILLNGQPIVNARAAASISGRVNGSTVYGGYTFIGFTTWSVSIFPIPKNNLPDALIEGN